MECKIGGRSNTFSLSAALARLFTASCFQIVSCQSWQIGELCRSLSQRVITLTTGTLIYLFRIPFRLAVHSLHQAHFAFFPLALAKASGCC